MPTFKVVYFNARGRAELTRLMLAHVGQEFEDVRYESEEWAKKKECKFSEVFWGGAPSGHIAHAVQC